MKKQAIWLVLAALTWWVAAPAMAGEGEGDKSKAQVKTFEFQDGEPRNIFFAADTPFELATFLGKGFLGVGLTDLTPELRAHFAESEDAGVLVNKVVDGSPAAKAGLRVGDVITSVDGETVKGSLELTRQVRKHDPDSQVTLEFFREGRRQLVEVTIEERERAMVDLGKHMLWEKKEDGKPWVLEMDSKALEQFPTGWMDEERFKTLRETLEGVDWESMADGFGTSNEALEKRLEALEERIEKMVEELARKYEQDDPR